MRTRHVIPFLLFAVASIFFAGKLNAEPGRSSSVYFSAPTLEGYTFSSRELLGHISVVNVFASWCLACANENRYMIDIANISGVAVYGLNYRDDAEKVRLWLRRNGNPYHAVILDPTGRVAMSFGAYGVPATFLLDQQGVIRYRHVGEINMNIWNREFVPVINQLR